MEVRRKVRNRQVMNRFRRRLTVLGAVIGLWAALALAAVFVVPLRRDAEIRHTESVEYHASDPNRGSLRYRVRALLNSLPWARIAFNTPPRMFKGQTARVELVLSDTMSEGDLGSLLPSGNKDFDKVKIADSVEANLTSGQHKIQPLTQPLQAIGGMPFNRWAWDVTPLESGTTHLHLELFTKLKIDERDTPLVLKTFDRDIVVEVSVITAVSDFTTEHWAKLTAIPAIVLFFYSQRRRVWRLFTALKAKLSDALP